MVKTTARALVGLVNDLSEDELEILTRSEARPELKKLAAKLRKQLAPEVTAYTVVVNCDLSLENMIKAGGYDYVNPDITAKRFPLEVSGSEEIETRLVHFGRDISTDAVLAELEKLGLRAATIEELLAFGAANPALQRQFPIAALGSVCVDSDEDRCAPYLNEDLSKRDLGLYWIDYDWGDHWRFLAVRK